MMLTVDCQLEQIPNSMGRGVSYVCGSFIKSKGGGFGDPKVGAKTGRFSGVYTP